MAVSFVPTGVSPWYGGNYVNRSRYVVANPNFGGLERSPKTDETNLSGNKTDTVKKVLIGGAAVLTAGVGLVFGIKKGIQKLKISEIENKFAGLKKDVQKAKKTFEDTFMRDNMTEKETLEMLDRYKEIEKIKITGTKEEYAKAIFDEAKKNYGLDGTNLEIEYADLSVFNDRGGGFVPTYPEVQVCSTNSIDRLMNVIHHELRHAKQDFYAFNYKPDEYVQPLVKCCNEEFKRIGYNSSLTKEEVIAMIGDTYGLKKPDKSLVPKNKQSFAQMVIDAAKNRKYDSGYRGPEYWNNPVEADARFAGEGIAKFFGLIAR